MWSPLSRIFASWLTNPRTLPGPVGDRGDLIRSNILKFCLKWYLHEAQVEFVTPVGNLEVKGPIQVLHSSRSDLLNRQWGPGLGLEGR